MKKEEQFLLWFEQLEKTDVPIVGGKSASLGEMTSKTDVPVPYGFATTAYAYRYFIEKIDGYAIDTLYQSPIEPNLLIATFIRRIIFEDYSIANSIVRISFDGGIKWESLPNLYKHPTNKSIYKDVIHFSY